MTLGAVVRESIVEHVGPRLHVVVPVCAMRRVKCVVERPDGEKVYVEGVTLRVIHEDFSSEVCLRLDPARFIVGERIRVGALEILEGA